MKRSRSTFVGDLGAGLAAVALSAQSASAQTALHDPVREYPHPPMPLQTQEWPGLAGKMTPRPDHGEQSYRGHGRLTGRRALITGGDSGIGRAAAIAFAREGADVAINYLPAEEPDAHEVLQLIRKTGRKAVSLPGDIRSEQFCKRLVANAASALGGLDVFVNCAARQHYHRSLEELTTEDFDWTFRTNVYALLWLTKAALPQLKSGSSIIFTASAQAYDPSENLIDYAQTKAAIVSFTKSLAKQIAGRGIRVNAVAPGPVWTPLQVSGGLPPFALRDLGADTPLRRPAQPAELAAAYVLLASGESSYVSGQVYGMSGGSGVP